MCVQCISDVCDWVTCLSKQNARRIEWGYQRPLVYLMGSEAVNELCWDTRNSDRQRSTDKLAFPKPQKSPLGDIFSHAYLKGVRPAAGFTVEHLQEVSSALLRGTQLLHRTKACGSIKHRKGLLPLFLSTRKTLQQSSTNTDAPQCTLVLCLPGKRHHLLSECCTIFLWVQESPPIPLMLPQEGAQR